VRESGRIISVAVILAVGVNGDGRREVLGMDIGPSVERLDGETTRRPCRHLSQRGRNHSAGGALLLGQNDEWAV
jgi:transposase-like protein